MLNGCKIPTAIYFTQFPHLVKRFHSDRGKPYLLIRLILYLSKEAYVLYESGLDVFIVHKLTKDVELLPQELVGEIDLMKVKI